MHKTNHIYKSQNLYFSGHYMYIETSFPRKRGQKAQLASSTITQTGAACVSFYYHMYGRSIGALNIYVKEQTSSGASNLGQPVWRRQGNQQNRWIQGQFGITPSQSFQVRNSAPEFWNSDISKKFCDLQFGLEGFKNLPPQMYTLEQYCLICKI